MLPDTLHLKEDTENSFASAFTSLPRFRFIPHNRMTPCSQWLSEPPVWQAADARQTEPVTRLLRAQTQANSAKFILETALCHAVDRARERITTAANPPAVDRNRPNVNDINNPLGKDAFAAVFN